MFCFLPVSGEADQETLTVEQCIQDTSQFPCQELLLLFEMLLQICYYLLVANPVY